MADWRDIEVTESSPGSSARFATLLITLLLQQPPAKGSERVPRTEGKLASKLKKGQEGTQVGRFQKIVGGEVVMFKPLDRHAGVWMTRLDRARARKEGMGGWMMGGWWMAV
jgi:hypothetical protein